MKFAQNMEAKKQKFQKNYHNKNLEDIMNYQESIISQIWEEMTEKITEIVSLIARIKAIKEETELKLS